MIPSKHVAESVPERHEAPDVVGLLDEADALRAELAHMREARDNARAEVKRLRATHEAVRALHYAADNDPDRTPICETCHGTAGVHECGCWAETDHQPICGHCHDDWGRSGSIAWPCPTVRALAGDPDPQPCVRGPCAALDGHAGT